MNNPNFMPGDVVVWNGPDGEFPEAIITDVDGECISLAVVTEDGEGWRVEAVDVYGTHSLALLVEEPLLRTYLQAVYSALRRDPGATMEGTASTLQQILRDFMPEEFTLRVIR
jgi:hypothetical protein